MSGGIEETSASFEARSAPRSYPTHTANDRRRGAQHHLGRGTPPDGLPERSQCGADHECGMARVVRLGGGGKSALSAANTPRLATRNNQRISSRERCYPRAPLRWCAWTPSATSRLIASDRDGRSGPLAPPRINRVQKPRGDAHLDGDRFLIVCRMNHVRHVCHVAT